MSDSVKIAYHNFIEWYTINLVVSLLMTAILVSVAVPLELYKKIDQKRGTIPRSRFCKKLIEDGLNREESN